MITDVLVLESHFFGRREGSTVRLDEEAILDQFLLGSSEGGVAEDGVAFTMLLLPLEHFTAPKLGQSWSCERSARQARSRRLTVLLDGLVGGSTESTLVALVNVTDAVHGGEQASLEGDVRRRLVLTLALPAALLAPHLAVRLGCTNSAHGGRDGVRGAVGESPKRCSREVMWQKVNVGAVRARTCDAFARADPRE